MRRMDEYEVLDRVLRITKKEKYADKVKEVYDLTKKIVLKTNEIDDDEAREATLYATIGFLIEKVKVGLPVRITILEGIKFELLRMWSELDRVAEEKILGDILGQED